MRAFLLACLFAAPAAAADIQADMLDHEKRLLGAVLADPAKKAEYAADAKAADDPAKKPALILKWRGETAAFAERYMAGAPATREGKKLKEMVNADEWGYLMATIRMMEAGFTKNTVIGMMERAEADLAAGDPERAEDFIKMAREKARGDIGEYQAMGEYKLGLAEMARRREEAGKEQAAKREAAAKTALEQAEQAVRNGGNTFDGSVPRKEEQQGPVIVPPKTDKPSEVLQNAGLKPSDPSARPNLTGPKEPPSPSLEASEDVDDMAELKKMKTGKGGLMGLLSMFAPVLGGILGAVAGFLIGGPLGALIGAGAGVAAGFAAKKLIPAD